MLVRAETLEPGGHRRRPPVRRLGEVDVEVVVGEDRAADRRHADRLRADAQLVEHLGHQPVDDAVRAAGAVVRPRPACRLSGRWRRSGISTIASLMLTLPAGPPAGRRAPDGSASSTSSGMRRRSRPSGRRSSTGTRPSTASRTSSTIWPPFISTTSSDLHLLGQSSARGRVRERPERDRAAAARPGSPRRAPPWTAAWAIRPAVP